MRHTILLAVAILAAATVSAQEKKGEIYMAANAHLDTQWNWTVQQTILLGISPTSVTKARQRLKAKLQ